jgi:hypothetical protein
VQEYLEWREREFGADDRAFLDGILLRFELDPQKVIGDVIARRQRRDDETVARAARAYANAATRNRRPAVADAVDYSEWSADKLIRDAKSRGYLADGELTDHAREILDASDSRLRLLFRDELADRGHVGQRLPQLVCKTCCYLVFFRAQSAASAAAPTC